MTRIIVHDYGGYAFIVGLSRALANRGHQVLHLYASRNPTPRGLLEVQPDDPNALDIRGVGIRSPLQKYNFARRWLQEREYGDRLAAQVRAWRPEVVLSANTPLDAQSRLLAACREAGTPFVFWVQDLIGEAMRRILTVRLGPAGRWLGNAYARRELRMLGDSSAVIVISQSFADHLAEGAEPIERMHIIPNWAPLSELPVLPKANAWSQANGLDGTFNFLYAGSLGLKHDPSLLLGLARALRADESARVAVVSEGLGAAWLEGRSARMGFGRMSLLPFQPMPVFPQVLATADVLVALLEPDAGEFSVPSKVLAYLCAGRPILLGMPETNPAAQMVLAAGAGVVVPPGDEEAFARTALTLKEDVSRRQAMGRAGRAFAESAFDLDLVTDRFEQILDEVVGVLPDRHA